MSRTRVCLLIFAIALILALLLISDGGNSSTVTRGTGNIASESAQPVTPGVADDDSFDDTIIRKLIGHDANGVAPSDGHVSIISMPTSGMVLVKGNPVHGATVSCESERVMTNEAGCFIFSNNYRGKIVTAEKSGYSKAIARVADDYIALHLLDTINLAIDLGEIRSSINLGASSYRVLRLSLLPRVPGQYPLSEIVTEIAAGDVPAADWIYLPNSECPGNISLELLVEIISSDGVYSGHFRPFPLQLDSTEPTRWYVARPRASTWRLNSPIELRILCDGEVLKNARVFYPSAELFPRYWRFVRTDASGLAVLPIGGIEALQLLVIEVSERVFTSPFYCPPAVLVGGTLELNIPLPKIHFQGITSLPAGCWLEVSAEAVAHRADQPASPSSEKFFEFPSQWERIDLKHAFRSGWTGQALRVHCRLMPSQHLIQAFEINGAGQSTLDLTTSLHRVVIRVDPDPSTAISNAKYIIAGQDRNDPSRTFRIITQSRDTEVWLPAGKYQVSTMIEPDVPLLETTAFEVPSSDPVVVPLDVKQRELGIAFGSTLQEPLWCLWPAPGGGYESGVLDANRRITCIVRGNTEIPIAVYSLREEVVVGMQDEDWIFTGYSIPVAQLSTGLTLIDVPASALRLHARSGTDGDRSVLMERLEYPYIRTRLILPPSSSAAQVFVTPGRYRLTFGAERETLHLFAGSTKVIDL